MQDVISKMFLYRSVQDVEGRRRWELLFCQVGEFLTWPQLVSRSFFFTIVWVEIKVSQNEVEIDSGKQVLSFRYWLAITAPIQRQQICSKVRKIDSQRNVLVFKKQVIRVQKLNNVIWASTNSQYNNIYKLFSSEKSATTFKRVIGVKQKKIFLNNPGVGNR